MSIISELMQAAKEVEIAKAQNPRLVQTIKQDSVSVDNNVQAQRATAANAAPMPGSFINSIPGGKNTLFIVGGLLFAGFVAKKVL